MFICFNFAILLESARNKYSAKTLPIIIQYKKKKTQFEQEIKISNILNLTWKASNTWNTGSTWSSVDSLVRAVDRALTTN